MQNNSKTFSHLSWVSLGESRFCHRYGHTSTLVDKFIIIFGGHNGQNPLNDVVLYDIEKNIWKQVEIVGENPTPRSFHTACLIEDSKIIIFGGHSGGQVFSQVEELELKNLDSESPSIEWKTIPIENKLCRYGHTAFLYEGYMCIFGGNNESKLPTNQLWMLDLNHDQGRWVQCEIDGESPSSRCFHMNIVHLSDLYVFGGKRSVIAKLNDIWKLDLKNMSWQEIKIKGWIPTPRCGFSAALDSNKIVVFGGDTNRGKTNEILIYAIERKSWQLIGMKGKQPKSRIYHTQIFYQGKNYMIGGSENLVKTVGDIWDIESNNTFDVVFEVEGQVFNVHKSFLAASCKYFQKMFASKMIESKLDKIPVNDVKVSTFQTVMRFIYFEDFELDQDLALDLLIISDKYLLPELTSECERFLVESLTRENLFKIVLETDHLGFENLRKGTLNFALNNLESMKILNDLDDLPQDFIIDLNKVKSKQRNDFIDYLNEESLKIVKESL